MHKFKLVIMLNLFLLNLGNIIFANKTEVVSIKTDLYELYAPNETELKTSKEEVEYAAKKFETYFGIKPPKIAVYVVNSPAEVSKIDFGSFSRRGLRVLPFISNDYLQKLKKKNSKKIGLSEARALSHEVGHKYFITYVNKKIKSSNSSAVNLKYGHPSIADWFDEAMATLSEYPILKSHRYSFLKQNIDKTIPFDEFFKMEHPFFAKNKSKLSGKKTITGEEAKKLLKNLPQGAKITVISDDSKTDTKDAMFYSQSLAISDFWVSKKGKRVIGKIANGLIEGKDFKKLFAEIEPKYSDLEKFEKDWKAWIKSKK